MAALWLVLCERFDDFDAPSKLRFGADVRRFLRFAGQPLSERIGWNARQAIVAGI
jgi:hypothetical protein